MKGRLYRNLIWVNGNDITIYNQWIKTIFLTTWIKPYIINGNFRILKWRYVTICLAIFCGVYPLKFRPYIDLIYGKYLQFRNLKWPVIGSENMG